MGQGRVWAGCGRLARRAAQPSPRVHRQPPRPPARLPRRVLEVCDRVKGALGPNTDCTITPAPRDSLAAGAGTACAAVGRRACKDVTSSSNLRRIVGSRKHLGGSGSIDSSLSLKDTFAERQAGALLRGRGGAGHAFGPHAAQRALPCLHACRLACMCYAPPCHALTMPSSPPPPPPPLPLQRWR